ncbi:Uncharacterized protein APZ42_011748 [Daphnia magna]|uniref:Uncharacterized protein n=1 Tax=Daphnia magna TaxID=35525 RepID=A0A162SZ92_9CRUS|nr:Uncharacterized protein APZ42_011748 [Daphnia magna]
MNLGKPKCLHRLQGLYKIFVCPAASDQNVHIQRRNGILTALR